MFLSQWLLEFSCEFQEILLALDYFQIFITNIRSNFRNRQEFCSISFRDSHLFHGLQFWYQCLLHLSVQASSNQVLITDRRAPSVQHRRCNCSLGCECESVVMPAALSPPLHAGGSQAIGHSAEAAERLGPPGAWSRLHGWYVAHNSKCSRCNNLIPANWQPPRCAAAVLSAAGGPAQARRVGAPEHEGCYITCYIAVLHPTVTCQVLLSMLYSSVTSYLPAVTITLHVR